MRLAVIAVTALSLATPALVQAQGRGGGQGQGGAIPSIGDRTSGLKKIDGFYPLYWDEASGRLWLEIPKLDTEVLYSTGLATGLGSNDIGLDRGMLTGSRIVKFERQGPRILMVQPNYQFRATDAERDRGASRYRCVRAVGPLELCDRRLERRPRARGLHRVPRA